MKNLRSQWFKLTWHYIKGILVVNIIFLVISLFWRLAFMLKFGNSTELKGLTADVVKAFALGARFDGTVLFYINAIPLLIFLIASVFAFHNVFSSVLDYVFKKSPQFLKIYYTAMLTLVTFIYAVDFGFYAYYQDRINILVFGFITDDTTAVIKSIWYDYPLIWIFLGLFLFIYLVFKGLGQVFTTNKIFNPDQVRTLSYPTFILFFLVVFVANGVGARGSLGLFPLSEMDTGFSKSIFINQLSFNGVRAFARAIKLKKRQTSRWNSNLAAFGYADNPLQAFSDFYQLPLENLPDNPLDLLKQTTAKNEWLEKNKPHVVLLVMEGLGAQWLNYQEENFDLAGDLKNHFNEENQLSSFISANNGTIGSLTSIISGTTHRPYSAFLSESEYLQVLIKSSPSYVFKTAGYETRFLYGGNVGWREVNKFADKQDFDFIEGENQVEQSLGRLNGKHDWGIFDEDFFKHILKTLKEAQKPQFVLGMSTTNHPPYQLPVDYQKPNLEIPQKFKDALIVDVATAQKRFHTYRYSADQIAWFISAIKNSDLKDKVIIAVTGDHNFWMIHYSEKELMQKHAVPFYIYAPNAIRKNFIPDTFGSHLDISPTLFNLALSNTSYMSLGRDLFKNPEQSYSVNDAGLVLTKEGGVRVEPQGLIPLKWDDAREHLIEGEMDELRLSLSKKYRALMGILDIYLHEEKKSFEQSLSK